MAAARRGTAIVTGAGRARGIAAGIAPVLAADGWDLVLVRFRASRTCLHVGMQSALPTLMEVAATLASLNLVFLGIVFSAFQQRQASHREPRANRYRTLAIVSLSSFVVGIADVAAAAIELLLPATAVVTTPLVVVLFFAQLLGLVLLSVNATRSIS